jgi:thiol-disulfide isomerase/thioredoxin
MQVIKPASRKRVHAPWPLLAVLAGFTGACLCTACAGETASRPRSSTYATPGNKPAAGARPGEAASHAAAFAMSKTAPGFTLPLIDGGKVSLASLKGKVVLLDFWATWCVPCRAEFPQIESLYKKYGPQGFTVLGMTESSARPDVLKFRKQAGATFPLVQMDDATAAAYRADPLPLAVLVDKNGQVIKQVSGVPLPSVTRFWSPLIEKALQ